MKTILGVLFATFMAQATFAESVTCEFNVRGLNVKASGIGSAKHKAHSAAVERCVDLRMDDYQRKHSGDAASEEKFSLFIDQCTTARCE